MKGRDSWSRGREIDAREMVVVWAGPYFSEGSVAESDGRFFFCDDIRLCFVLLFGFSLFSSYFVRGGRNEGKVHQQKKKNVPPAGAGPYFGVKTACLPRKSFLSKGRFLTVRLSCLVLSCRSFLYRGILFYFILFQ